MPKADLNPRGKPTLLESASKLKEMKSRIKWTLKGDEEATPNFAIRWLSH